MLKKVENTSVASNAVSNPLGARLRNATNSENFLQRMDGDGWWRRRH